MVTKRMVEKISGELEKLKCKLEEYLEAKEEVLDNENNKDYPNEDRLSSLETQCDNLSQAKDMLEEAINALEEYE